LIDHIEKNASVRAIKKMLQERQSIQGIKKTNIKKKRMIEKFGLLFFNKSPLF